MRLFKTAFPFLLLLAACGSSNSGSSSTGSSGTPATGSTSAASTAGATTASSAAASTGAATTASSATTAGTSGTTGAAGTSGTTGAAGTSGTTSATAPQVTSTSPQDGATDIFVAALPSATFDQAMDPSTLTSTSFVLMQGQSGVSGQVSYDARRQTARFTPSAPLQGSLTYTATISTDARSAAGLALTTAKSWSFTTRATTAGAPPVDLGTSGDYAILAETQISTVPASAITGDIAVSPAAETYITGFSLTDDASGTFATSPQVTGKVYAADQTSPTSSNLTTAIGDMDTAFTDAASRPADVNELGAGDISGMTLPPGVYKWGTGLLLASDVHLTGAATDVWIFEIAQDLTVDNGVSVFLAGGAVPKNVFWQVSGAVSLGTTSHFEGVILCQTAITLGTGASVNGRLLAQSAVSIDTSTIVQPAP